LFQGASIFSDDLTINNNLLINNASTINSSLNITNNLNVSGYTIINDNSTFNSLLHVNNLNINNNLNITGSTLINGFTTMLSSLSVLGNTVLQGNLNIGGNLTVNGTTTSIISETVNMKDNLILINSSQTGTPALTLQGGIEVERGDLNNYRFVFVESDENFKIGVYNTVVSDLQSVATREDTPTNYGFPYWNPSNYRLDTTPNISYSTNGTIFINNLELSSTTILGSINANTLSISNNASLLSATVTSTLSVLASITTNSLNVSNNSSLMSATITSSLSVLGPVNISNNTLINGSTTITSNLLVSGEIFSNILNISNNATLTSGTITSSLSVLETLTSKNIVSTNDSTFNSILNTNNIISISNSTFNSNLQASNLNTNYCSIQTSLNSYGSTNIYNGINITGNTNINGNLSSNTLFVNSCTINSILNINTSLSVLGTLTVSGVTYLQNNLEIAGNLTVNGTTTAVNAESVNIKDNLIVINSNQTGTPLSTLQGGIEIERGDLNNYRFVFVESDDSFKIGVYNTTVSDLQSVATRENIPISFGIPYWNSTASRFDTNANLKFDTNTNSLSFNNLTLSDMTCTNTLTIGSSTTSIGPFTSSTRTILKGETSIMTALFIDGITTCKSNLTVGTTVSTFNINMNGGQGSNINFKFASTDHAVGYYGGAKTWNSINVDGPVLYGYQGGLLGFSNGGISTTQGTSIRWDTSNVTILSQLNVANGIKFPSVSGASSLILSSYAEGTWTPTMAFGTFTLTTQYGTYTKIGRTVHLMG